MHVVEESVLLLYYVIRPNPFTSWTTKQLRKKPSYVGVRKSCSFSPCKQPHRTH